MARKFGSPKVEPFEAKVEFGHDAANDLKALVLEYEDLLHDLSEGGFWNEHPEMKRLHEIYMHLVNARKLVD
jgi:hypothetical protein